MTAPVNNKSSYTLARSLHRFWTDHAVWLRHYLIAAVDERPEAAEAAARVLRNTDELAALLDGHYARRDAKRVAKLLKQHVMIAFDLIDAARAVDPQKFKDIEDVWANNADDFIDELCALNVSWSRDEMKARWDVHCELTKEQMVARLEDNFDHDVAVFDRLLSSALNFADDMTDGILRQFADKFAA